MKLKFPLLLALITTAGLIAADAPAGGEGKKPEAPKGKGEGKGKGGFQIPGVSAEDMQKYGDARKAAMEDAEIKKLAEAAAAARAKGAEAKDEDAKKAAREEGMKAYKALNDAVNAAIVKAHPELADVVKKAQEAMANRGGKGGKGGEGKGKPEGKPEAKPEAK
ncbi:hypothetical protein EBR16_01665 [bacterium]|jgi:hypothetical protein|nr:hypothetical protein [bacterium]